MSLSPTSSDLLARHMPIQTHASVPVASMMINLLWLIKSSLDIKGMALSKCQWVTVKHLWVYNFIVGVIELLEVENIKYLNMCLPATKCGCCGIEAWLTPPKISACAHGPSDCMTSPKTTKWLHAHHQNDVDVSIGPHLQFSRTPCRYWIIVPNYYNDENR